MSHQDAEPTSGSPVSITRALIAAVGPIPIRVLQVEDSSDDAELVLRALRAAGFAPDFACVDTIAELRSALTKRWDVVISDYHLAEFEAPEALAVVRDADPDVPFIIVSGSIGEESAVEVMRAGAQDFFLKDRLQRLGTAVARDIERARARTERRAALAELRETRGRLQALFDQAIVGIAQLDVAGRFVYANQTFCDLVQRSFAELILLRDVDVVAGEDASAHRACLERMNREGTPCTLEVRYARPDGTVRWGDASLSPLRGPENQVLGTIAVVHDASERRRAEKERQDAMTELAQTVQFNELFVGILGHDLRNPLSTISMAASVLARLPGFEAASPTVERIARSVDRMKRMIEQLLDFTRIRIAGGIPLDPRPCDLAAIAHQAVDEILGGKDGDVRLEVRGETTGTWDRDRLLQLVSNLVANAIAHGTKTQIIRVAVDGTDDARVRVLVENGGHIPEEVLPFVFEPLHASKRLPSAALAGAARGGLGLGLFIVRQIALAHGGDVLVTSSEAEGTYFEVVLPRAPSA